MDEDFTTENTETILWLQRMDDLRARDEQTFQRITSGGPQGVLELARINPQALYNVLVSMHKMSVMQHKYIKSLEERRMRLYDEVERLKEIVDKIKE